MNGGNERKRESVGGSRGVVKRRQVMVAQASLTQHTCIRREIYVRVRKGRVEWGDSAVTVDLVVITRRKETWLQWVSSEDEGTGAEREGGPLLAQGKPTEQRRHLDHRADPQTW